MASGEPLVTIVVTPRERFGSAVRSLSSVIENTSLPHRLVYVSGGDPPHVLDPIRRMCRERGYELIERSDYLGSNTARNLGLARASTKYVVFAENDVIVEPGWLEALVTCAEETGAAIVGPLTLYGEAEDGQSHTLGGDLAYLETGASLVIEERPRLSNVDLKAKLAPLQRSRCDYVEFHCLLARRDLFEAVGTLDEAIICAGENIDLCLLARRSGHTVYVDPASIVTISGTLTPVVSDAPFFEVRWSEEWFEASMERLSTKWRFPADPSFVRDYRSHYKRYREICRLPRPEIRPAGPITSERHPFAKTIDGLAAAMAAAAYPADAIEAVRHGYRVAEMLHTDVYRPNGRPHLTHALGTAAVLAAHAVPRGLVVAGLLHAAYSLGRFPTFAQDLDGARRFLRREIGDLPEAQVWDYYRLSFENAHAAVVEDGIERTPLRLAQTIVLRIANSIEEHLDHGLLHTPRPMEAIARNREQNDRWMPIYSRVAESLRCREMLDLLLALHEEVGGRSSGSVPEPPSGGAPAASTPSVWPRRPESPRADRSKTGRSLLQRLRPPLGPPHHEYDLQRLVADHGATVRASRARWWRLRRGPRAELITGPEQWSYAATLDLDPGGLPAGECVLRVVAKVDQGRLGVGVLWTDRSDLYILPEQSIERSSRPLELRFSLAEMREAGPLVFRSWTPEPTRARILSVSLHAAPTA